MLFELPDGNVLSLTDFYFEVADELDHDDNVSYFVRIVCLPRSLAFRLTPFFPTMKEAREAMVAIGQFILNGGSSDVRPVEILRLMRDLVQETMACCVSESQLPKLD
jgi:hypothetical protein